MKYLFTTLLLTATLTAQAQKDIVTNNHQKLLLDTTVIITGARDVWAGQQIGKTDLPQAFTGKGVISGIIDMGFDTRHPMSRLPDGTSRVRWFWDPTLESDDSTLGTFYDTPEKILAAKPNDMVLLFSHATHVAGIMAGSEFGGVKGIANESEMFWAEIPDYLTGQQKTVFIEQMRQQFPDKPLLADRLQTLEGSDLFFLLAVKKMFNDADALGRPCVINFSYGSRNQWMYTSATVREVISEMLQKPGHIIVAATGNDGVSDVYREKKAGDSLQIEITTTPLNLLLRWKRQDTPPVLTLKGEKVNMTVTFDKLMADAATWDPESEPGKVLQEEQYSDNNCLELTYLDQLSNDEYVVVKVSNPNPDFKNYTLSCDSHDALRIISSYMSFKETNPTDPGFQLGTVGYPAGYTDVIGVGAMHYRNAVKTLDDKWETNVPLASKPGQLASISSCGPTIDNIVKPDVVAPGHNIISAFSGACIKEDMQKTKVYEEEKFGAIHRLAAFTGTSMATPCVAGIIALWLQANPKLTQQEVMEIIRKTSHQPDSAYTEKNNYYGWGVIDAYAGILEALKLTTSIRELSTHQPVHANIRLQGKTVQVSIGEREKGELRVYTTSGVLVGVYTLTGDTTINLSHLSAGVYALQLNTSNQATTGSTLIRL